MDQARIPTSSPQVTLGAIEHVLDRWQAEHGIAALGVASFGPVDLVRGSPTFGCITTTTKRDWQGADIAARLERRLKVPMSFDTDVNGAALSELRWGAGRGLSDIAYITVGTGVGVGLIANGQPVHGFGHPEVGHIRVVREAGDTWPGSCCFHGDCAEGLASGSAIVARIAPRSVEELTEDDPVWTLVASAIAQVCHSLACTTASQRILIGGGVIDRQEHLLAKIEKALIASLAGYVPKAEESGYLQAPGLGAMAGPLGSIALAMDAAAAA
jgi:fructokinase